MKEIWKDISGFEEYYQVSNLGRVKSCPRQTVVNMNRPHTKSRHGYETWNRAGKLLQYIYEGYQTPYVRLYREGTSRKSVTVKELVYNTFHDTNLRANEISFKDGDPTNVELSNLYDARDLKYSVPQPRPRKSVRCIETGVVYESLAQAANSLNRGRTTLRTHIHSRKPLDGHTYEFVKEDRK